LDDVLTYIAVDSVSAARRVLVDALEAASSLATMSKRGRVVPELEDRRIRELFVQATG